MPRAANELLTGLLKDVSRSFYLTLRVLPRSIRPHISLAYLLARTSDTVADTEIVPLEQRLDALQRLRERFADAHQTPLDFSGLAQHQGSPAERLLLEKCEQSLMLLQSFPVSDQQLIRSVLDTITSGQELDLCRFAAASATNVVALQTEEALDEYTYRVAGCVGRFWTDMCVAHVFSEAELQALRPSLRHFEQLGIRFGKGLQLTNILRDVPQDLRRGRCYLPKERLVDLGLQPADLTLPANETKLRPLYNRYLDIARDHLVAGWEYVNRVPRGQARVRLACAWPILIGLRTIERLRLNPVLDPGQRIKVSRSEVRRIILRSVVSHPWSAAWRKLGPRPAAEA